MKISVRALQRQRRLQLAGLLTVAVMASPLAGCASSNQSPAEASDSVFSQPLHDKLPEKVKSAGVVRVGAAYDDPPMVTVDSADARKAVGVAPDLAAAVGRVLGVKFEYQNTQWPGQLPGLSSGSLDVLWGQVSDTAEREKTVADLVPYFRNQMGLVIPKGNPKNLKDLYSACGATIAISSGAVQSLVIKGVNEEYCKPKGMQPIKINEYSGIAPAVTAILSGTVDAALYNGRSVAGVEKSNPDTLGSVQIPIEQTVKWEPGISAVAVDKSNPGLSEAIAGALGQIVKSGEYKKILEKWQAVGSDIADADVKVNLLTGTAAGQLTK